jgi:hypothetical protein
MRGAPLKVFMPDTGSNGVQSLHERLRQLWVEPHETELNATDLVKVLLQITEALVSGESHAENHSLRLAREHGVLDDFACILRGGEHVPKDVKVQVLQSFMMLVQNARGRGSMECIFEDDCVNRIITTPLDWQHEEIIAYYICFLKSMAMRLEKWSVPYFYLTENDCVDFPLYTEAVRFFCHRDHMVRAAVRTLTLHIYGVDDERLRKLIVEHSASTYFVHLACHLRELWARFDKSVKTSRRTKAPSRVLLDINEQQKDLLIYISDVMELGVQAITDAIAEQLLRYCFLPMLLGSLTKKHEPSNLAEQLLRDTSETDSGTETQAQRLQPEVSLFLFQQVLSILRSKAVIEPLLAMLFLQDAPRDLLSCCTRPLPPFPATYRPLNGFLCGPGAGFFSSHERTTYGPRCCSKKVHPKPHGDSFFLAAIDGCTQMGRNHIRQEFLLGLSNCQDGNVLLTAGVLHSGITRHGTILQGLLERFRISLSQDLQTQKLIPHTHRGRSRESVLCMDDLENVQEGFDQLDIFLDIALEATPDTCSSPYVLTEVQNLPTVSKPDGKFGLQNDSEKHHLTRTAIYRPHFNRDEITRPVTSGDGSHSTSQSHLAEVLLRTSKALQKHTHVREVVLRTLAKLVVELVCKAHVFYLTDIIRSALSIVDEVEHLSTLDWQNLGADSKKLVDMKVREGNFNSPLDVSEACSNVDCLLTFCSATCSGCIDDLALALDGERSLVERTWSTLSIIRPLRKEIEKYAHDGSAVASDKPPNIMAM